MEIIFSQKAQEHLLFWKQSGNKKILQKIEGLLTSISVTAFEGIGNPEALKHELSGFRSRRIDQEHRIVYRVVKKDRIEIVFLRLV